MGQPKVASATWRDQSKRISRDFYETVGQQLEHTVAAEAALVNDHARILNRALAECAKLLRKPEGNGHNSWLMGRLRFDFCFFHPCLVAGLQGQANTFFVKTVGRLWNDFLDFGEKGGTAANYLGEGALAARWRERVKPVSFVLGYDGQGRICHKVLAQAARPSPLR